MRYADRETNRSRFPDNLQSLLGAMLDNKRTLSKSQDSPKPVASAIRYDSKPQDRMDPYDETLTDSRVQRINGMFDFEKSLDFQRRAWSDLSVVLGTDQREPEAALVTAPTGFGKTEAFLGPVLAGIKS